MLHWTKLIVTTADGDTGTLGDFVADADADDMPPVENGQVGAWHQYFISAPGEEPDWDTPRGEVDWSGFAEAVAARK